MGKSDVLSALPIAERSSVNDIQTQEECLMSLSMHTKREEMSLAVLEGAGFFSERKY